MIEREHALSITRLTEVLQISRGSVCYPPLAACRTPMSRPCGGSTGCIWSFPSMVWNAERPAGCRRLQDRPPTCEDADAADGATSALSPPAHHQTRAGHKIHRYVLRGMEITRPNQVWAMDITYIAWGVASSISP